MKRRFVVQTAKRQDGMLLLTMAPETKTDELSFQPGQYATLGFRHHGRPTPVRCFSMVNAPSDTQLQFAMRVRGRFTSAAALLEPGDRVTVTGPYGTFTMNEEYDKSIVMFAGGIGVTPFMSMLRHLAERRSSVPVTLVCSNHAADTIPFKEELLALAQNNPYLRVIFFVSGPVTEQCYEHVQFIHGAVSTTHVRTLTEANLSGSTYFMCGPNGYMNNLRRMLLDNAVDDSRIVTESFTQSSKTFRLGNIVSIPGLTYGLSAASLVAMFGVIMFIDVSRNVSHITTTASQTQAQVTEAASTKNSSTSSQSTTATTTQSQDSQESQYQTPVTSVS